MWQQVSESILKAYPQLETEKIQIATSSCRYFILPDGFKDVGQCLVFGATEWGTDKDCEKVLLALEAKASGLGLKKIIGPLDFSTYFDYRLRIDYFEEPTFVGEPNNSPKVIQILMDQRYQIEKKFYSHEFKVRWNWEFILGVVFFGAFAKWRSKTRFDLFKLSKMNYQKYLPEIYELTDGVFSNNYLYQKIPFKSFEILFEKKLLPVIDNEASMVALDQNGRLVGYSLCLQDFNNPKRLLFKTIGVKKEFRNGSYLGRQLMREVYLVARKKYKTCLACMMIEGNKPELMFRRNSFYSKTYALFSKNL
jgi:hypothetical protein